MDASRPSSQRSVVTNLVISMKRASMLVTNFLHSVLWIASNEIKRTVCVGGERDEN